jgi:hypothetical protein
MLLLEYYQQIHQNLGVMDIKTNDLEMFLEKFPQMSLVPSNKDGLIVQGVLSLDIMDDQYGEIIDDFFIKIVIPKNFPEDIPTVYELEDRFPKTLDYHTYPDASLCLGSKMSLKKRINETPTLEGFIHSCVVPYFYAIAMYLQGKERFVFGELSHGLAGIIQDYMEVFELSSIEQVIKLLEILSLKSNQGNKKECPCGCNRIVTKCSFHKKVVEYRKVMTRKEYEEDRELISLAFDIWKKESIEKKRKAIPLA